MIDAVHYLGTHTYYNYKEQRSVGHVRFDYEVTSFWYRITVTGRGGVEVLVYHRVRSAE